MRQSIASHDRQIGENAAHIRALQEAIEKLVAVTNQDATAIRTLARIADAREQRISGLEETAEFVTPASSLNGLDGHT